MIADIGARFLILLQTSKINYKLPLDYNSIGYPLINDDNEKGGVEFIMYILSKMIEVPEYASLDDKNTTITELKLIERIKITFETKKYKIIINNYYQSHHTFWLSASCFSIIWTSFRSSFCC